jgi:hypothetical protein
VCQKVVIAPEKKTLWPSLPPPPPEGDGVSLPFRPPPLPPTPSPIAAAGRGRRATPAAAAFHSPRLESGSGPWRRCSSGGSGPARPGDGGAVASRDGAAWQSARAVVAAGSGLAMFWATRASDGLRWASNGLGRAGAAELAVVLCPSTHS